jgi:hypothetical protein
MPTTSRPPARRFIVRRAARPSRATTQRRSISSPGCAARMDQVDRLPDRARSTTSTRSSADPGHRRDADGRADRRRHLLYIHGGAYVLGSPRSHIAMAARLARLAVGHRHRDRLPPRPRARLPGGRRRLRRRLPGAGLRGRSGADHDRRRLRGRRRGPVDAVRPARRRRPAPGRRLPAVAVDRPHRLGRLGESREPTPTR